MSPLIVKDNKLLIKESKLATSIDCCCNCTIGLGILICNSNAVTDDDFDVVLNGKNIGQHRARDMSVAGELFKTDNQITKESICLGANAGGFPCQKECAGPPPGCDTCVNSGGVQEININANNFVLDGANNVLSLINTQDNKKDNYGLVQVYEFCLNDQQEVVVKRNALIGFYSGPANQSFQYNFTLQADNINPDCTC